MPRSDSVVWWIGMATALVTGLLTVGDTGVVPASWTPYLRLAAVVLGIVSGKMATASAPSPPPAGTVIDDNGRTWTTAEHIRLPPPTSAQRREPK